MPNTGRFNSQPKTDDGGQRTEERKWEGEKVRRWEKISECIVFYFLSIRNPKPVTRNTQPESRMPNTGRFSPQPVTSTQYLTRINRKYETRNSKYETNPKFQNSNVSNKITVVTKLNSIQIFVDACTLVLYKDANKCFAQFAQNW